MLEGSLTIERAPNAWYQAVDVAIMVIFGVLAGAKHVSQLIFLRVDGVIRKIFSWEHFPDNSTFGRIVRLFTPKHCQELSDVEDALRRKVWNKKWFGRITLDLDSTVRGVLGKQEGAHKGYHPEKKGQKSYHPLLCFIAETRECLHNWFRSGDAYSANGSVDFLKECLSKVPKRVWSIVLRADSAFFDGKLLAFAESRGLKYVIKVAMKGLLEVLESQSWHRIKNRPGWESTTFIYQCGDWPRPRKFVAVKQRIESDKAHDNQAMQELQRQLEEEPSTSTDDYHYFCYVTNMNMSPWGTHKFYGHRGTSENWIAWCKDQMAAGSMLTQVFWATSALFQLSILAYNLLVWMLGLTMEHGFREEPNTVRLWLIHVPAKLVEHSRQLILKLSRDWYFKHRWLNLEQALASL